MVINRSKMLLIMLLLCILISLITLPFRLGNAEKALAAEEPDEDVLVFNLLPDEKTIPDFSELTSEENISDMLVPPSPIPKTSGVNNDFKLSGKPNVLIYHTHTTEAFRMNYEGEYKESSSWRTNDMNHNITAVGKCLIDELNLLGFFAIQDTTNHEPPKLSSAYSRSEITMKKQLEQNRDIGLFIDLHRDAANTEKDTDDFVVIDGKECARIMFVVGKGEKYNDKPDFEANYALALRITEELESIHPGFTRQIRVKTGRYNQHIGKMSLLIEVGHNANTLEQAMNSVHYIALAISRIVSVENV